MGIPVESASRTIPFPDFWAWLWAHHNCILRAGTADTLIYDQDDFHWHLFTESDGAHIVQVIRGKQLLSEIVLIPGDIAYVQGRPTEYDDHMFECIIELPDSREVAYHFVMAHAFEAEVPSARSWTH